MCDTENIGELLVKLCRLSKTHDVDIRIRRGLCIPNVFEIVLDRKEHHALGTIDITKTFIGEPEQAAEYVFRRALYDIEQLDKGEFEEKI